MLQLNEDESFHYELLRTLGHARYQGADVGEVLEAAGAIVPGDFESFSAVFSKLADRVYQQAEAIDAAKYPVSARDAYFRASTYFRAADFYLHGNAADPRLKTLWDKQTTAFDRAIALLPVPGERLTLRAADGAFTIPCIYYRAEGATAASPRPTIILGNGYDGAQEEMLHVSGLAALERGYNVITYEGPGQPTVLREQGLGFIAEWERVVTPVVDHLVASGRRPEVDGRRVALLGLSMGGFLCVRAAAFEHRLAAVLAVDGVYDVFESFYAQTQGPMRDLFDAGEFAQVDELVAGLLASGHAPSTVRWGIEQGIWSFRAKTVSEYMLRTRPMTLAGVARQVRCPAWVGCAADDLFFAGQPEKLRDALRPELVTYRRLTADDSAGYHCHVGAMSMANAELFAWLDQVTARAE